MKFQQRPKQGSAVPEIRSVVQEGLLVFVAGIAFALIANFISPSGLTLRRDYFLTRTRSPESGLALRPARSTGGTLGPHCPPEQIAARLKSRGLQLVESNQVAALFRDPRYEQELVVFVDARNDRDYARGHVPGAYQLDHYHPEKYLASVLPVCQTADQIVVYCNGGGCEDSELAALTLSQAGIPKTNLFIYAGGLREWATNGLPVELGARSSGNLRPSTSHP